MFKYQPTVEEISQTTTLNQPFQIEFTVLPAKSDSESNIQDIGLKRHLLTLGVLYKLMCNIVLALYYILSNCKQHLTSLSLLVGTTVANQ